jgi:L,D-transpeptidase catalytic domain
VLAVAAAALAVMLAWPNARLQSDGAALASAIQPWYAGSVSHAVVRTAAGTVVPVRIAHGTIVPTTTIAAGTQVTVEVTVKRPGWVGWLVGSTATRTFTVRTPEAQLRGRWLEVRKGGPVSVSFTMPVRLVVLRGPGTNATLRFPEGRKTLRLGTAGVGLPEAGGVSVRAVARTWERLPPPSQVHWFPARKHVQALVAPAPGAELVPGNAITVTFSRPTEQAIGTALPTVSPTVPGTWQRPDSHTLSFVPTGVGWPLDGHVTVALPRGVEVTATAGERLTRTLAWDVSRGTILRLQQLLAESGYLPVEWAPAAEPVARTAQAQVAAAVDPPAGHFNWPYANTPKELHGIWRTGQWNEIVRGAVMMFQDEHGLDVDAFVGPQVWHALLADAVSGKRRTAGYSYVFVHRSVPQLLTLWHDGNVILTSPGNTGVPAAPTQLGTFPVFEHIPVGTMSGTNPDGTHYHDPGIRWISYFNHGEALHAFPRASFGTPQSLGCVELPLDAAAKVWSYTPIGTLVTIEN